MTAPEAQLSFSDGQNELHLRQLAIIIDLSLLFNQSSSLLNTFSLIFCLCLQDLGAHTRVSPAQRKVTMGKFVDSVNSTPEARQELENWGLSFENDTIHVSLV